MAEQNKEGATKRDHNDEDVIHEGGLPKDHKTANAGDNRGTGDLDGNRTAPPKKQS